MRLTDPTNVLNAGLGVLPIDSHTIEIPLASLTNGIVINGGSGPEIVNVDFSGGNHARATEGCQLASIAFNVSPHFLSLSGASHAESNVVGTD